MVTQPGRSLATVLTVVSLGFIGLLTLRPEETSAVFPAICVFCGGLGGVDFVLNTLVFMPLGASARWLTGRWKRAVALGIAATLLIETLQWGIPGRHAALGDLIANTLGTMAGAWLAIAAIQWVNSTADHARRLGTTFAVLASGIIVASALLLLPVPTRWQQYVQWTPIRPNTDPFSGRLLTVELNERPLHAAAIVRPRSTWDSETRGITVRAQVQAPSATTPRRAIIVRIANSLEEGFMLSLRGERVVFRNPIVAGRLKLRSLEVGLGLGLPVSDASESAGHVTELFARSSPRAVTLRSMQPDGEREVVLRRTIGLGWTFFTPFDIAIDPFFWPANALWLGALVLPVTFFVRRVGRQGSVATTSRPFWWPLALVLGTMVIGPSAFGLSPLGIGESFGVAGGIGAGILLERWTALHTSRTRATTRAVHHVPDPS